MVKRYTRKCPATIRAVQWVNNNEEEIEEFVGTGRVAFSPSSYNSSVEVYIRGSHGKEYAEVGDYIVLLDDNDVFIWGRNAFEKTYKEVE